MQQKKPLVSVIIPVYKVEDYLEQCVISVIHQSYKNIEIILIDDGSPDGCPQMCDAFAKRDSRIRVIHKENGGLSDARNAGLSQAKGELIAFVDSDDWITLDMIEKMTNAMFRNQADMVICQFVTVFEDGHCEKWTPGNAAEEVLNRQQVLEELLIDKRITNHVWRKLYKKSKIPKDIFPKGINFEDIYVMPELVAQCEKIVYITDPLYFYRNNKNGILRSGKLKDQKDYFEAFRHAQELILRYSPELKEQVKIYNASQIMNCWIGSINISASEKEKDSFQRQLSVELRNVRRKDICGKRVKLWFTFAKIFPGSSELYNKVLGDKNSYALKLKHYLERYKQLNYLRKVLGSKKTLKFIVVCTPEYGNLGDQALLKGEQRFVEKFFPEYQFIPIPSGNAGLLRLLKKYISQNDIIALQAGGNIGTLYPEIHRGQEFVMHIFANGRMIIFPQTFYYSNNAEGREALKKTSKLYRSFNHLKIFVRDPVSEMFVREKLPDIDVSLMPDMALMNRPQISHKNRTGALICMRNDLEATFPVKEYDYMLNMLEKRFAKIQQIDTHVYYNLKDDTESEYLLNKIWMQMSESALVITDRLHGMIFAMLTRTPCVTILSRSPKVEGVYGTWLEENKMIKIIHSIEEFPQAMETVLLYHDETLNLKKTEKAFKKMATEIEEIWNRN